ncbi:MAG: DNA alkylation repair protein, partial [Candidatus Hodarchaeota archaeon]
MVSISSVSEILKRAINIFNKLDFNNFNKSQIQIVKDYLKKEYDTIPEKERIGKGRVYISKVVAKSLFKYLKKKYLGSLSKTFTKENFININLGIIGKFEEDPDTLVFGIHLTSNFALDFFDKTIDKVEKWAINEDWEIRENAVYPILSGLKSDRKNTLNLLSSWVNSENPNIRRLVAESLRPKADIKWLRDSKQNDDILKILTIINHDDSIYVRKAVGNNLKDLTKYMPDKILKLIEEWMKEKDNLSLKEQKNLIYIIYKALRWLKDRNPKYHNWIEKLVGKNYLLYYDEKRNINAIPPDKK